MSASKRVSSATLFCLSLICVTLFCLAVLPPYFVSRKFDVAIGSAGGTTFPVDVKLGEVTNGRVGKEVTLKELASKYPGGILVNFWATWCPPCLEELPSLETLHRQLERSKDGNLPRLFTVSVDEKTADIVALFKTLDFVPSFPVLFDKEGALARQVGTTKFPETYWINSQGQILHKWIGPQNWIGADVLHSLGRL